MILILCISMFQLQPCCPDWKFNVYLMPLPSQDSHTDYPLSFSSPLHQVGLGQAYHRVAAEFSAVLNTILHLQQTEHWFWLLVLTVAGRGGRGGKSVSLSIQSWLSLEPIKSEKNEELPPVLPLVSVGTSITEAEKSLKLKPPSSWVGVVTVGLVLQKTAAGLKGNHATCFAFRRTLVGVKPQ